MRWSSGKDLVNECDVRAWRLRYSSREAATECSPGRKPRGLRNNSFREPRRGGSKLDAPGLSPLRG